MAGIISNVDSDVQKLRKLKNEIEEVKKALKGINIKVDIDIAKGMEAQLKSLTEQYNALVAKVVEAEGKIMLSTKRINDASERIIQAQEKVSKAAGFPAHTGNTNLQGVNATETAGIQTQAKAYQDLKVEINAILGTREANVKRMIDEMNAIRLINAEIKKITKLQGEHSILSSTQQKRIEQLNNSLLTHKAALSEVRQTLSNNVKLDNVAATSMNGLSQSLSRMKVAYRELTEEERNSPIGKELLTSINQADARIKELDATIGNHQRNIGNYGKQWNGLSMSIQQVGRELPSLAYGPKVFFSAISNNLPILADEIKRARIEYDLLKKSGQSATPVWKQIVSSLFSWQSVLTVGITLLTLYGDKVIDWIAGLFKAKDTIKELLSAEQEMALARKKAISDSIKERTELDLLYKKLKDTSLSTKERTAAVNEWMKKYPQHSNIMNGELVNLGKLELAYRSLSKQIIESAKARAYADKITELTKKREEAEFRRLNSLNTLEKSKIALASNGSDLQKTITQNAKKQYDAIAKEVANYDSKIAYIQKKIKVDDLFPQPEKGTYDYWQQQVQIADAALKQINSSQKKLMDAGNFKGIDAAVVKSYKDNVKKLKEAEKELKVYDSSSKQESAANKLRKQQEGIRTQNDKISEIERKQAIQRKRRAEDMEMEISQSEIDAMTEGAEKKRMQRELDNRKEIQSLERQKEDMIQAVIQAEKEIFDAQEELKAKENNNYQKKTFDSSKVDTGKISSIWDTIIENTSKKQLDDKIREQEASWNEYLIKFGNYQQKRLAIIEKYDKTIKEAETAGDAAILMKEKANALDDFDNSVKNSTTLMGQLFVDASQKSVNEIQGIIEKAELLMQYLAAIKDEQGNAQIGGKTVSKKDILGLGISDNTLQNLELSTEQVEALRNAIDRLKGELGGKSPFKLFETQVKQATDKIAQGGKKNIVQGISEIGSAVTQFTPAISQFGQDLGTIFGNDDLGNKIAGISDALGGVGQTAMGVGQIMSGDIVGGAMSAVSGISSVVKALDGLFGADYSRYNEMKSQYEALDSVWDTLIDKKKEYIKMSYGDEAYKVGKETETLIKQQTQRYYELLNELRQSGSSIGSSSLGKRIEKRLSKKDWDRISGAVGESVTNAESLLNLSAEQLKEVLADPKLVSVLNTVNGDFVKYIQDIVNGSEKLEDIQNQVKEQLTQVSFDSVFDNFVDTLMDMDSSAKDFANNFERYMQKAMLTTMLGNKYKAELQKWYDAFAAANDNKTGISEENYKKLQEQWNDIVTDAVKERDKLKELLGWTSESSSQDSTKRGFEAMSQDTGEELNGRFTALQITGEEIKNQSVVQSQALNLLTAKADTILSVNTEVRNIADDTRNLIANSYLELMQISENTGAIVKPIQQMQKDIAEVKKNIVGLAP
ncbi:hypothetical protein [Bacteroides fragilis]|uniref:hypothetical protein n=1 Tax=Bacteroides fragilis TaxID=817 RepID=UPI00202E3683|nr:hypothetical protein [Bacteroides fragilis]